MSLITKKAINVQLTSFQLLKIVKFRIVSFFTEHRIPAITLLILLFGIVYSWTKLFLQSQARKSKKLSLNQESVSIGFDNEFGETPIYRHVTAVQGFKNYLENGRIQTVFDLMRYCRIQFGDRDYLGSRNVNADGSLGQFEFLTYEQSYELSLQLSQGLASLGARSGDRIGFYSSNCMEWKLAEGACYHSNLVVVSLYDSLGPNAVEYILSHSALKTVFCSHKTFEKLIQAIENMKYNNPIQHIILLKTNHSKYAVEQKDIQRAKDLNVQVHTLQEVVKIGSLSDHELTPPTRDSIATIMYTSGTTGEPKGVILTHGNIISSLAGFGIEERKEEFVPHPRAYLSYLPLAHIMERTSLYTVAYFGGKIGFYSGDIQQITSDFLTLQPTDVAGVPRTYQKIYDKVMHVVEEHTDPWSKWLFKTAYRAKQKALKEGRDTPFYNRFVFNGIRDLVFGSRVERALCGSAPLSEELHDFLRIVFSVTVIEGYGLTETTAGATSCETAYLQKVPSGRVGSPLRCVELKLVDVSEMGYTSQDKPCPRGEICIRGGCVFKGYYNDPEKTKEAFDANGWFRTGDIGKINTDGTFSIIDRKKNIFKLNQGEYIAPDYLENVYCRASLVSQCFIYGDSQESCLVAVVVPDTEAVETWAEVNRKEFDMEILCNDQKLKNDVLRSMQRVAKETGLMGYEIVRAVHLESEPWTLQNNMLTPTFKLKRGECKTKYENEVKRLYEQVKQTFVGHASSRS